jgi:poly(U)-specific endoribonuclease
MTIPSAAELDNLGLACQKLWDLDDNRLVPDQYDIDVQDLTTRGEDAARGPLFARVSEDVWEKPTYKHFKNLLDNYLR